MEDSDDENWSYCEDCDSYVENICRFCNRPDYKLKKNIEITFDNDDERKLIQICNLTNKFIKEENLEKSKKKFIKEMKSNNFDISGLEVIILESKSLDDLCNIISNYYLMPERIKKLQDLGYKSFIKEFI